MAHAINIVASTPNWIAVNKRRGCPAVPLRVPDGSSVLEQLSAAGFDDLRTVGRLDRPVGGLMLLATNAASQRQLTAAWHEPATIKEYTARVLAPPPQESGTIDRPIGSGRKGLMRVGIGKPARTSYEQLVTERDGVWLRLRLHTGRRHQIRLHLASIGCPVAGDTLYYRAAIQVGDWRGSDCKPQVPDQIDLWCTQIILPALQIDLQAAIDTD